MEHLQWRRRPRLRRPVLLAAFEGWNDAADAASTALRYLGDAFESEQVATLDPDEFYDFTVTRPQVRLVDGLTREIAWPEGVLSAAVVPDAPHDLAFFCAVEPHLRWKTYAATLVEAAEVLGAEMVVTLGALLAEVPHSRPVRVSGTAANAELVARLGLQQSRYQGPTGIVGVLHDACAQAGMASASLWAAVPHYVAKTPSPKAALALVERASDLLDLPVDTVDLEIAAAAYERQITEVVADDEEVAEYVRGLEEGEESADDDDVVFRGDLPSGDALAREAERFLREHGDS